MQTNPTEPKPLGERFEASSRADWRSWLERNHATAREIWLVIPKQGARRAGPTYAESVEEALCFGWIDSQSKGIDAETYAVRYTPRRRGSNWSASNRTLVPRLVAEGRMTEAGRATFPADLQPDIEG